MSSLDQAVTAWNTARLDRALGSGARTIEGETHRTFRPVLATKRFDWPNPGSRTTWRLWLDNNEVISVSGLTVAGSLIPASDYFLRNLDGDDEPPYDHIEIDLAGPAAFRSGDTHQQAIALAALYGHRNDEEQVGDLTSNLDADVDDTATITWNTPRIGVGDVLRVGSERMVVRAKTWVDTGQNTGGALTAQKNSVSLPVTTGTEFAADQILLLDSERVRVLDVAGNTLTLQRAVDGSVLAAHNTGIDIFSLTGVELDRAQLGTTLAAHVSGADVYRHVVPDLIRDYNIALAISQYLQESAGYARTVGAGEAVYEVSGKGLKAMCDEVYRRYGRKARIQSA